MSSKKHKSSPAELNKTYEENDIRLKGILYFGAGLAGLIVVTFALMWALLNVFKDYHTENAGPANPMLMSEKEKLPPEPRLQLAPGFGVDTERGRVNLELMAPQAEYRVLHKEWIQMWEHGQKDAATGVTRMMPIDEAKEKFLASSPKAKTGPEAEALLKNSKGYMTEASAGRLAAETRR